jgi:hypothetical protein
MAVNLSMKHLQIDKANSTMVLIIAVATFLTIFALVSCKTLYKQMQYQDRVATARQVALNQLVADVSASKQLVNTYANFVNTSQNLIGGSTTGDSGNSGDNGKIVLDALPSVYDYPALTSSVQYLLNSVGVNIDSIGGTDEEATITPPTAGSAPVAATTTTTPSATAVPGSAVAMPFEFAVDGPYANIQNLLSTFQSSIRPFQFQSIQISGDQSDLTLTVTAQSFYQPEKDFKITTETVN